MDWSKDVREQIEWNRSAHFMNSLVDDASSCSVARSRAAAMRSTWSTPPSEDALRARFAEDPWARNRMLTITGVERWTILLAPEDSAEPGIQSVPASGTRAIAAASTVRATRSSGSRLWTCDFPQARASVCVSSVSTRR